MRADIHPQYHEVDVRCACGATWKTHSTKKELHLEICSSCHPFFTGRQKLVDTEGRVERFMKKYGKVTVEGRRKQQRTQRPETRRWLGVSAHPPRSMTLRLSTSLRCVLRRKLLDDVRSATGTGSRRP